MTYGRELERSLKHLEFYGLSKNMRKYMGFQEPFLHENNLSANKAYTDKVVNNLKDQISKRNLVFGIDEIIDQISHLTQDYTISLKQHQISDFV